MCRTLAICLSAYLLSACTQPGTGIGTGALTCNETSDCTGSQICDPASHLCVSPMAAADLAKSPADMALPGTGSVCTNGWCWEYPLPQGNALMALWNFSSSDVWAVGLVGTLMHLDGTSWSVQLQGQADLESVWGSAPDDVWAVGQDLSTGGAILHYDGTSWSPVSIPAIGGLYSVFGSGPTDVWAVGDDTSALHYDGTSWQPIALPMTGFTNPQVRGLWGSGPTDMWTGALGALDVDELYEPYLMHWDGTQWTPSFTLLPYGTNDDWGTLTGLAANDVWTLGQHWNGEGWELDKASLIPTWEASTNDLWGIAYGAGCCIGRWNGSQLTVLSYGAEWPASLVEIRAVRGTNSNDVWAVGDAGTLSHWDGLRFTTKSSPAAVGLASVWVVSADEVWVGCTGVQGTGPNLHRSGGQWTLVPIPGAESIWGSSATDIWGVGLQGRMNHYQGGALQDWPDVASGTTVDLNGIWGSGPSDIWAVGGNDTILHYDGTAWTPVSNPGPTTNSTLSAVWGSGPKDVWTTGFTEGGSYTLMHWNGTAWSLVANDNVALGSMWGTGANDIWALGVGPGPAYLKGIYHYDGTAWSKVYDVPAQFTGFSGISGTGPKDIWVGLSGNYLLHFDGTTWTPVPSGANGNTWAFGGAASGDIWAVSDTGAVLHHAP